MERLAGAGGSATHGLHYVGPMLKAPWWEAIAIPELRVHARDAAMRVLAAVSSPSTVPARAVTPRSPIGCCAAHSGR